MKEHCEPPKAEVFTVCDACSDKDVPPPQDLREAVEQLRARWAEKVTSGEAAQWPYLTYVDGVSALDQILAGSPGRSSEIVYPTVNTRVFCAHCEQTIEVCPSCGKDEWRIEQKPGLMEPSEWQPSIGRSAPQAQEVECGLGEEMPDCVTHNERCDWVECTGWRCPTSGRIVTATAKVAPAVPSGAQPEEGNVLEFDGRREVWDFVGHSGGPSQTDRAAQARCGKVFSPLGAVVDLHCSRAAGHKGQCSWGTPPQDSPQTDRATTPEQQVKCIKCGGHVAAPICASCEEGSTFSPQTERTEIEQLIEKWRAEAVRHKKHGDCHRIGQGWALEDCADQLSALLTGHEQQEKKKK